MIRDDVSAIPAYVPGRAAPDALKLSSNEAAHPPLPSAVEAMTDAARNANRYPDMGVVRLKAELADTLGLTPDQIAVGCGSSALCQQLVQATCRANDEVIFAWRSFEAYPIFCLVVGAKPVMVPLDGNHRHDLDAMAASITDRTRLIFVCNPNNPTGTNITEDEFTAFMERVPEDVVVVLDEAYIEYVRDEDNPVSTELLGRYPNLVGMRTFSKAYGLAGVRVGYAFGDPRIIDAVNRMALPFSVNAVGQAGALASLTAADELLQRTDEAVEQREALVARIPGAVASQTNFVWIPTSRSRELAGKLAERGVLIRAFDEGVRVTVTTGEELNRFLTAWDEVQ
ncbi:histidinol-phosphate transaminase [Corynebacterium pygosceleis]|uniref:Aromatic amino acid aminotransferase n=1 Tax=Corynebacterium pygosceleis TaxID=2800406 RepID=A0A9Q4GIJ8_9CORY|nr:histidinol-phosphate transaminase [Corynebacterium pygosceleis]MCK7637321.1 histidinol-phosphate transaminase [Corynebacterium pygosceleis]MCK7675971.1 histidinol-phosphate transaminase [Corynebacterium pygosceleis]MCL0119903.1 histidinol-phosphate transaminase [Corynebacterium pygosceleis]MCX7445224.1 histidinol-phosphate transaminase [Corynebacterium pygosceleis]MCX7468351.1 histidinol-phosphate transaminase [Corynebacterium pygosceleis]